MPVARTRIPMTQYQFTVAYLDLLRSGPNPQPQDHRPASNGALVRELRALLSTMEDLDGLRVKRILTLERRLRTVEQDRAEARGELKREKGERRELWLLVQRFRYEFEELGKKESQMQMELEGAKAALREVSRELEEGKHKPSKAVASFLWLARFVGMMVDLTITHFVNRVFEARGISMVILGLMLVYCIWWFT